MYDLLFTNNFYLNFLNSFLFLTFNIFSHIYYISVLNKKFNFDKSISTNYYFFSIFAVIYLFLIS